MKKIFTLLFAAGMIGSAQAQSGAWDNRTGRHISGRQSELSISNNPFDKNYRYDTRLSIAKNRTLHLAQINREFDFNVQKVRQNRFMNQAQKQRLIRSLDEKRREEIQMVNARYKQMKKRKNGRDYPTIRHY